MASSGSPPCVGRDPELWFPANRAGEIVAKAFCAGCPLWAKIECLKIALDAEGSRVAGGRHGIFGGLSEVERARLARQHRSAGDALGTLRA